MSHSPTVRDALRVSLGPFCVRVDPALARSLSATLPVRDLEEHARRILRLYLNCDEPEGPAATLADVMATPAQSGWQRIAAEEIASGAVVEDPGYFDVAALGPLPDEPAVDGPCRYLIGDTRVWLDPSVGMNCGAEMWLLEADPTAHAALATALYPRHPPRFTYAPPTRTQGWPFIAVVDPTVQGIG